MSEKVLKCSDCYYLKRVHPFEAFGGYGTKAICTHGDNFVALEWEKCKSFRSFIGSFN